MINKFKHSLTILFSFCSLFVFGQNTISRNNYFISGNSYPYVFLDNIEKDSVVVSGNNAVWDFSNSVQSSQFDTLYAIDPATTVFYNDPNVNYNISNLCLFEPLGQPFSYDDNLYSYYTSDPASIHFIGNWANNGIWEVWYYHLTDTEKYFAFPFSLNDNFQDSFSGSAIDLSGTGFHSLYGTRNVQADGFGTLILPSMIYPNCLRLKSVRNVIDSSMFGYNYQTRIFYTWFQLNTNGYILEVEADSIWIGQSKYYYNNPLINGLNETKNDNSINIFPNPFTSAISISLQNKNVNHVTFIIRDLPGQSIFVKKENNLNNAYTKTIDVSFLSKGIYLLDINIDGERTVKKIVKE
ncbi:MAG TPA: T9SS type A sorting domain-containing protein [Bacteroidia bacterium]|nr:T9SS type A sorting domain-containing protein [Bacteroidia bacterium]